ncbi:MAG: dihydropyrimidinase [Methanoregulaceae archaeon]
MYDLLVRDGLVVSPAGTRRADIAILDGRIVEVGAVTGTARRRIDASGLFVLPGGVEPHMHVENDFLGLSTANDFYTQSIAAAFGGTTTLFDFAAAPRGGSLLEAIERRKEQMRKSALDHAIHGRVLERAHIDEVSAAAKAGCPSFKLYLTYPEVGLMVDDATVLEAFVRAASCGALPLVHAESDPIAAFLVARAKSDGDLSWSRYPDVKPPACEAEAFGRVTWFARTVSCPIYVVHTTVRAAVDCARRAHAIGQELYVETCPQYLVLDRSLYDDTERGPLAVCSPPLRGKGEAAALWVGLADGTISAVGSDDCAYTRPAKEAFLERDAAGRPVPDFTRVVQGVPGIECRLPLLLSEGVARGRITIEQVVGLTSTNPARYFGLYPRKGVIAPGADADLVLVDLSAERTLSASCLHTPLDYCLYEGLRVRGWPVMTISSGGIVVEDGEFTGTRGAGRFLEREVREAPTRPAG